MADHRDPPLEWAILGLCMVHRKALGVGAMALHTAKKINNGYSGTAAAACSAPGWLVSRHNYIVPSMKMRT